MALYVAVLLSALRTFDGPLISIADTAIIVESPPEDDPPLVSVTFPRLLLSKLTFGTIIAIPMFNIFNRFRIQ